MDDANITIPLQSGKSLTVNITSLKNFFDSCEGKIPSEISQSALEAFSSVCNLISEKNPVLAEHLSEVAKQVLANLEIA